MKIPPVISICILTYNHENYIEQCLDGIFLQNIGYSYEIIISDDCSTDKTFDLINNFLLKKNVTVTLNVNKVNKGVIGNLIELLKLSKGKYIAICEGDDYWCDKNKINKQIEFLENNKDCSLVFTNRKILTLDGNLIIDDSYKKSIYKIADVIEGFIPGTQTMMFRNYGTIVDFFNKYSYVYSGDRYIAYFCSLFGNLYKMDDVTSVYRHTNTGIWFKNSSLTKLITSNDLMIGFHKSLGIPTNNEVIASHHFYNSLNVFFYCIKRPLLIGKKKYISFILRPFSLFNKMNRIKLLLIAILKRIRQ
jgi:glycosyltransferase involved in cell wall biosynthesis